MTDKRYRVAVFIETSRGYGRALCEGIADFAQANGHWVFLGGGESWEKALREISGKVDGVIARIPNLRTARALTRLQVPIVDLYRWSDYPSIASVDADHSAIAAMAAGWFIERRFQHFAYCGYSGAPFSDTRESAFKTAVEAAGHPCSVYTARTFSSGFLGRMILQAERFGEPPDRDRMAAWLKTLRYPTAIFCCHDIRAYQVVALCKELGIRVPQDAAVMGVDNDRILCDFSDPVLTSVEPNARQIGWAGAQQLLAMMSGSGSGCLPTQIAPARIVERASTETDPVEPPWLAEALRFVRQNIARGVNAEEVFLHVGLSHTLVERICRQKLGCTLHKEISRLRMREACRLLRETGASAAVVAERSGFSSPQYFNRTFYRTFGLTPCDYRRSRS